MSSAEICYHTKGGNTFRPEISLILFIPLVSRDKTKVTGVDSDLVFYVPFNII